MELIAALFFGGVIGFAFGRGTTKYPNEEVMMDRLVIAATERRMLGVTRGAIVRDVEARVQGNLKTGG